MTAARVNITLDEGAPYVLGLAYKGGPQQQPVDLTGCGVLFEVRESLPGPVLLALDDQSGDVAIDALAGKFKVTVPALAISALPAKAFYRCDLLLPGAIRRPLLRGVLAVNQWG